MLLGQLFFHLSLASYMALYLLLFLTHLLSFFFPPDPFTHCDYGSIMPPKIDFTTLFLLAIEFIIIICQLYWHLSGQHFEGDSNWQAFELIVQPKASSTLGGDGDKAEKVRRMVVGILWYTGLPFLETVVFGQYYRPRALVESKLDERTNRLKMKRETSFPSAHNPCPI